MLNGIAAALLKDADWLGRARSRILLAEVDEGSLPALCQEIRPRLAVVTNFFRDQLDRYGELDLTVRKVRETLPPETVLVLNADDPLVARLGLERENAVFYGTAALPISGPQGGETREGRYCVCCGAELSYTLFHYGQLGLYACESCGFRRPQPQLEARAVSDGEQGLTFALGETTFQVALHGYYNLYNALAALAAAFCLGVDREAARAGMAAFTPRDGRLEKFDLPEGDCTLILVKNPMGFNQVLAAVTETPGPLRLLIAINDLAADGRDVSWLWDVDFERLTAGAPETCRVVCAGLRGADMQLRLKYAGLPRAEVTLAASLPAAVGILRGLPARPGERIFILPTYTALAPLRQLLLTARDRARKGAV
jgi:UDP-N-acetylmuramyl tripeptide synthase